LVQNLRHGLKDGFDAVSEGKLVDDFLFRLVEVDLPRVLAVGLGKLHFVVVLFKK
jgi:hypothetical protein